MIIRMAGWTAVVISVLILLVFAGIRFADMAGGPAGADGFGIRYVEHRGLAFLHIVPGLLFLTLAPLQFVPRIRQRHLPAHRRLGWVPSAIFEEGRFGRITASRKPSALPSGWGSR